MIGFAAQFLHLLFAAIWVGGVFFMGFAVVPAARDGRLDANLLRTFSDRFTKVSLSSVVVLLVTGGHMAGTRYTFESLTSTTDGQLVLAMIVLWAALAGVLHLGARELRKVETGKVMGPAREALRWYRLGVVLAVLLVLDAVLITYPHDLPLPAV